MIEAKSVKVIRSAELRAEKLIDDSRKDSEMRIGQAIKSAENRMVTETRWAKARSEKLILHAKKSALEEQKSRYSGCEKDIAAMKKSSFSKKQKAIQYILREIFGGEDV